MQIENPVNAFVRIREGSTNLLIDPWTSERLYEGGWAHYPPFKDQNAYLKGVTHVFITHVHEDHFDTGALEKLDRRTVIFIPKVFAHQVMLHYLKKLSFTNINLLEPQTPLAITPDLTIEVIPPMNGCAQEFELYKVNGGQGPSPIAIDTGLLVQSRDVRAVFLADNSPYSPEQAGASLARMKLCDVLAFPFNGAAADYPTCYRDLSTKTMKEISDAREQKRAKATDNFIQLIKPKSLLPYSSDFAVAGPKAKIFAEVNCLWWADREQVANRYSTTHDLPAFALREGDVLEVNSEARFNLTKTAQEFPSLNEVAATLYSNSLPTTELYAQIDKSLPFASLMDKAAQHMFGYMKKLHLVSEWILRICAKNSEDTNLQYIVDLKNHSILPSLPSERKVLTCYGHENYIRAICMGVSHWNNATLSFQLEWLREPNEYNDALYRALNFFHVARGESNSK